MSARPDIPRLTAEELDLLISRSLDGDLSPEEEQRLERIVALDPAAAARKEEIAALVAETKALPEPAPPFALSTRVSSNVVERAGRPGSLGGRVGFFPAPGFAKAALVILGIVGASIAILRPAPKRLADGPVDVYLYSPAPPASKPESVIAESRVARTDAPAKALAKDQKVADARTVSETDALRSKEDARQPAEEIATEKKQTAKLESARQNEVAATTAQAAEPESGRKRKTDRDEGAALGGREQVSPQVAGAVAQAPAAPPAPAAAPARAAAARDGEKNVPRGWTVAVRGDAARRWALRRAPDDPPPARGAAVYRVTLDGSGRVIALSRVGASAPDPRLDAFVRGMLFEPVGRPADAQVAVGGGSSSSATTDFEIGLEPR